MTSQGTAAKLFARWRSNRTMVARITLLAMLAVGVMLPLAPTEAQQRGIPRDVRSRLVGCWVPWEGERWSIRAHGATGLVMEPRLRMEPLRDRFGYRARHPGSGPRTLTWVASSEAAQMDCGPRTQHGQFCMLRPKDDGTLAVGVYGRGHGERHRQGRLSFTTTARRCAEASADVVTSQGERGGAAQSNSAAQP